MIKDMDVATLDKLKNISEPHPMVHDVIIATFLVLGDHDGLAMVHKKSVLLKCNKFGILNY